MLPNANREKWIGQSSFLSLPQCHLRNCKGSILEGVVVLFSVDLRMDDRLKYRCCCFCCNVILFSACVWASSRHEPHRVNRKDCIEDKKKKEEEEEKECKGLKTRERKENKKRA
jgi:hypothetical protein